MCWLLSGENTVGTQSFTVLQVQINGCPQKASVSAISPAPASTEVSVVVRVKFASPSFPQFRKPVSCKEMQPFMQLLMARWLRKMACGNGAGRACNSAHGRYDLDLTRRGGRVVEGARLESV